jgi:type I restriction enzyme S subunit
LPEGWEWVRLGDVAEINPRRQGLERDDDALTTFVPMPAVDDLKGGIIAPETKAHAEVKKGYTYLGLTHTLQMKRTAEMGYGL